MKRSYFKYIAALLLFGSNGLMASHIHLTSYEIVLLRTLLGSLLLTSVFILTRQRPACFKHKKDLLFISISGVAMGASWMFLYEAYAQMGVSISSLLYYCGPILVMVLAPLLFKEKLTSFKVIGFIIVLCGVFLINGNIFESHRNLFGIFCSGMSAIMYAVMVLANKKSTHITGLENPVLQLIISFFTVAIFVVLKNGFTFHIQWNDWVWILILGFFNTGLGCYFYFSSIGTLPVQAVAIWGYLEPLSAVLFSVLLLSERMSVLQISGAVLILGGAMFAEYRTALK